MKKSNILAIITSVVLVLTFLTSCEFVKKDDNNSNTETGNTSTQNVSEKATVTSLTAKKLFQFNNYDIKNVYKNYLTYRSEDGNGFGVKAYTGEDTGLIFDYVSENEGLLTVSDAYNTKFKASNAVSNINVFGLFNSSGKKIAGCEYACFERLNDRYVEAYKAKASVPDGTDDTINKGEHFVSKHISGPAYSYDKVIIDFETGKVVDENQIHYYGSSWGDENKSFDDASYVIRTTETDTVYNSDNEKLFDYNPNEYKVVGYKSGYYIAEKKVDGNSKYFILDTKGSKLSADFDKQPSLYGNIVSYYNSDYDYVLYDFEGKQITNEAYDSVYYDELSKDLLVVKTKKDIIFLNGSGKTLLTVSNNDKDEYDVYASDGLAYKKSKDSGDAYYNFAEGAYSITSYRTGAVTNMLVKVTDGDSRYDLIDATNGTMLCEGYKNYNYSKCIDGCCIVAAERTEGGYDIYKVQNKIDAVKNSFADDEIISANQLNKIYEVKEDLFAELEKALKDAGLSASVNRDTGEVAFDAAVVFAGDSSTVSEEGKKLLDAFTKAYSTVLSNDKYKGFISKTVVEGHTAPLATSTYESGLPLSKERAEKVKDYCKSVDPDLAKTFEAIGYSNSMPIYNTDGTINQDASRRVTFKCIINSDYQA